MKQPKNYKILRDISSKARHTEITPDMSYLIIYSFLYKYCSDLLKDHVLSTIEQKEFTLDEAFRDEYTREILKEDGERLFGYFISSPDYFIDEVINTKYSDRFFIYEFVEAFSNHVSFPEDSNDEKYFKFIFDIFSNEVNLNKFEFEGEGHLIVKEIIFSISKLDIFEEEFTFQEVFRQICQPRILGVKNDSEYMNTIISAIIAASTNRIESAYNPCLKDASSIITLIHDFGMDFRSYGRCENKLAYCASIVNLLINYLDLNTVVLEHASPFEEPSVADGTFDVIFSSLPSITPRNVRRFNRRKSSEIAKRNKEKQLQGMLSDTLNIDETSFAEDDELKNTLKTLVERMDLDKKEELRFFGEYEELNASEYLFLIALLNSLNDNGMMVLSMNQSFLAKQSLQKLRKYLIWEKNCIDAVISIPDELSRPKRSEIIVVFKKHRQDKDIVFIDMSNDFKLKASKRAVPGMFRRNLVLDSETLNRVIETYIRRQHAEKFSNVVGIDEIARGDFNLSISRYVDTFEGEFIKLENLKNEKKEITSKIKELNNKIDVMMDDLGLKF